MDYQKANDYCHAAWFGAGSPPGVDVEDLIQEYLLAELEGLQPDKRFCRVPAAQHQAVFGDRERPTYDVCSCG